MRVLIRIRDEFLSYGNIVFESKSGARRWLKKNGFGPIEPTNGMAMVEPGALQYWMHKDTSTSVNYRGETKIVRGLHAAMAEIKEPEDVEIRPL